VWLLLEPTFRRNVNIHLLVTANVVTDALTFHSYDVIRSYETKLLTRATLPLIQDDCIAPLIRWTVPLFYITPYQSKPSDVSKEHLAGNYRLNGKDKQEMSVKQAEVGFQRPIFRKI
jgi:hypothetical protein